MLCWCGCVDDDQSSAATWARQCQNTGRLIRISVFVVTSAFLVWRFSPKQQPDSGDIGCTVAVSKKAIVADAVLALWQDVDQEPADELGRRQRHGGVAACAFKTVIFDAEGNTARIETYQSAVGYCNAVGVSRQICQYCFGSGEGFLGVDDPVDFAQRLQERIECGAINEVGMVSKELQLPSIM